MQKAETTLPMNDRFLTPKQYFEELDGPPPSTQVRVRAKGDGPRFVIGEGGRILYPLSEIVAWRSSRLVSSTSEAEAKGLIRRGGRFKHLPEARAKARAQRSGTEYGAKEIS